VFFVSLIVESFVIDPSGVGRAALERISDQAVEENREHEGSECHVHAVMFLGESDDGKGYPGHRGCDEQE
jgi:hypothetical protein